MRQHPLMQQLASRLLKSFFGEVCEVSPILSWIHMSWRASKKTQCRLYTHGINRGWVYTWYTSMNWLEIKEDAEVASSSCIHFGIFWSSLVMSSFNHLVRYLWHAIVQAVAKCLMDRGPQTLRELILATGVSQLQSHSFALYMMSTDE